MRAFNFWYSILSAALGALLLLLFDNMLYAAIVLRLRTSFGIEEADMTAWIAANLILILVTIIVLLGFYRLSLHYHMAKGIDLGGLPAVTESSSAPTAAPTRASIRSLLHRFEPLPAIALGLTVAVVGVGYYQYRIGRPPAPEQSKIQLSPAEVVTGRTAVNAIIASLRWSQSGVAKALELRDNWQYQIQVKGPDDFYKRIDEISGNIGYAGMLGISNAVHDLNPKKYPDIMELAKFEGAPDCYGKSAALLNELKAIKEHNAADMIFNLTNNIQMADWRAVMPECDKWAAGKLNAAAKILAQYQ